MLCLSLVMVIVGNTVLNVALPTLVRELDATSSELQWIVDAYALVFAGLLLTAGALGDRFGRKGALTIGLVIFGLASVVASLVDSPVELTACRAVMGVGAALVMPATLSILTTVFPPAERPKAIGIWAGLSGAGAAIGPITGGYLLEHFWWGSVFLVNVPIVILALVGGRLFVPTSRDPAGLPLDPVGAGMTIVGLGALLYAIIEAPEHGWTAPETLGAFAVAAAFLGAFAWWELRIEHPMLDLHWFRNPRFSASSSAITLVFFAMFGTFFLLTQYLQLVRGYSALEAGICTLPMPITMMLTGPNTARLVERFGSRRVVAGGLTAVAVGLASLSRITEGTPYVVLAVCLVILAAGMASTVAPATSSIMSSLPMGKAGVGSAVNDTTRELGGALGVAVLGSLLASQYSSSVQRSAADLPGPLATAVDSGLGAALQVAADLPRQAGEALSAAAKDAFLDGFGVSLLVAAVVALLGAVLVARFSPSEAAVHGTFDEPPEPAEAVRSHL